MSENIELARFSFNTDDVVKSAALLRKEIEKLKKENQELRKSGDTSSTTFVENEAALKSLTREYRTHVKALDDQNKQLKDNIVREELLNGVIGAQVTTIEEAREQNKLLNKLRNQTNTTTEEGQATLKQLNSQLDRNNELIKENVDQYTQQKINIGNYADSMKEALADLNLFNGGITNVTQNFTVFITKAQEAGGVGAFLSTSLSAASKAFFGLAKASLAFIATPIGAVIAALAAVFLLVQNAMNRNEEAVNKLKAAFAPFTGLINGLLKALEPLGEYIIEGIVFAFELLEKAVYQGLENISRALRFLGFDDAADSVEEFTDSLIEAAENSQRLAEAEANLTKARREARLVQLQYQKEAEEFRQIRDDETKTIQERIEANNRLSAVLEQQLIDELAIARQALVVANLRIEAEGQTEDALNKQAEALTEIADIEERITGQRSEQLTNQVSLQKEAADLRQKALDKAIEQQKQELDLFVAQQGERARTLQEELDLERKVSDQKLEILKAELNAKTKTQTQYATEVEKINQNLARRQAEIAVDNAQRELQILSENLEERQAQAQFLSDALVDQRKQEFDQLLYEQRQFFALQLEQGIINQDEYDEAIRNATLANLEKYAEIDKEREKIKKEEDLELRAIRFSEDLDRMIAEGANRFEIQQTQLQEQSELEKARQKQLLDDGVISQELYNARIKQLDNQLKEDQKKIEEEKNKHRLNQAEMLFGNIAELLGKQSAAGKAAAVAQATINTYQGVTEVLAADTVLPEPFGVIDKLVKIGLVLKTGFDAVKNISKTNVSSGGSGGGGSSPRIGQSITADSGNQPNLNQVSASNSAAVQQNIEQNANQTNLADTVKSAVSEGAAEGTKEGSKQGIVELSSNKRVQKDNTI